MPMAFTIHVNILVLALKRMINMKMIKARSLDSGDGDFDDTCILHPVWNILHATSAWKLGVLRVWAEKNILKLHKKKQFLKKKNIWNILSAKKEPPSEHPPGQLTGVDHGRHHVHRTSHWPDHQCIVNQYYHSQES